MHDELVRRLGELAWTLDAQDRKQDSVTCSKAAAALSAPPEAAPKLTEIVHIAVSRALDEANIRNEVLRGMCIEGALETLPQPQNDSEKP